MLRLANDVNHVEDSIRLTLLLKATYQIFYIQFTDLLRCSACRHSINIRVFLELFAIFIKDIVYFYLKSLIFLTWKS